jgi:hypothetical protein
MDVSVAAARDVNREERDNFGAAEFDVYLLSGEITLT